MAPRNPESIRQRITVGSLVNQRVRLTWHNRVICSNCIINHTETVEGVIRRLPERYGYSILTDDNRSVGYFVAGDLLSREEGMLNELAHLYGFDGVGNHDYSIVQLDGTVVDEAISCPASLDGRALHYSYESCGEGFECYRAWEISSNSWIEVTTDLMAAMSFDGNRFRWVPGGRAPSFYYYFDAWQRANSVPNNGRFTLLHLI